MTSEPAWLEVSLIVDGEMAEAAAEVLNRFAPSGVAIESTAIEADDRDQGGPVGPLRVAAYLPVDENLEEKRRRLEESLWYLGRIRPLPEPQFRLVYEADWAEAWKAHYQPIPIGERLIVVPAWLESPSPERVVVRMDPGMAFGTGTHPSTQLCLQFVESALSSLGERAQVVDVGCGSGILSIAALKLGARQALGVDTDPQAVRVARENAELNEVQEALELGVGSVEEILAGKFSLQQGGLVLANILAPVLVKLLNEGLERVIAPDGSLVMAGIIDHQVEEVMQAARAQGLQLLERLQEEDWVALRVGRTGAGHVSTPASENAGGNSGGTLDQP